MTIPFSFNGALNLQADPSLPAEALPYGASGAFGSEVKFRYELTGAGTRVVNFGTAGSPGAKFLAVSVDLPEEGGPAVSPVNVQVNGGGAPGQVEVSAGGFVILCSPTPATGITSLSLVHTADAVVTVRILE
jgi:hypothetical protein